MHVDVADEVEVDVLVMEIVEDMMLKMVFAIMT